ncbi:MAG: type II toxin-antitoxin system HicA family toxin [Candidatus Pacebacteria bacterium]|nr:type II toxin-antitoxin system HicA family toxin [Candidatus Paceibacterota bacterium]
MPNNKSNWTFKEVVKFLESNNFRLIHIKGSHYNYSGNCEGKVRLVSVPKHKTIATGTMGGIIKQSGIPKEKWIEK